MDKVNSNESAGHIKCDKQLTDWYGMRKNLQFAVDQLEKDNLPYKWKKKGSKYAVFVPTPLPVEPCDDVILETEEVV